MKPEEALLVEQLRLGDTAAGLRFVRVYRPRVHRYVLRMTDSVQEAEDLTQEAFVQAWGSLPTFEGRSSLTTWLMQIARNVLRQSWRGQRPAVALDPLAEPQDARAAQAIEAVEVRAVLQTLPLEEREVVILFYLYGHSCQEVADTMELPLGTVKRRLAGARAHLRHEFGIEETGAPEEGP